jgi:ABC-type branched-subunit amino acid transport system ATPase component
LSSQAGAILELSGVSKAYGGVQAVQGCDFTVPEGAVIGLIGPNGAGKSTTIDLVSGFQNPDSGSIRFAGTEIAGMPAYKISRLGLIRTFQASREWAKLTVIENMLVAAPPRGRESVWRALVQIGRLRSEEAADRVHAREVLERLNLIALKDERAGNLSGGQKRLLEFARILMARPRMVLLDEPLAGVNPVLSERIHDAIKTLQHEQITVLLVEHNLPFVERVCDSVIVMALGKRIAVGSMEEMRGDSAVVDAYLGEVVSA